MYEHYRNEIMLELDKMNFSKEQIEMVINCMNKVSYNYEISKKKTELAVREEVPKILKTYMVCKKIEGYSMGTLENIYRSLSLFYKFIGKRFEDVKPNNIRYYLYNYKEQRKIKDCTLEKYRQCICCFYEWAHSEGYIETNPAHTIKAIKFEKTIRKPLKQIDLERVRLACKTEKDRAIIDFLYSTGCRVNELCNVKLTDIDFETKTLIVFGKGKKYRTVMLNAKSLVSIEEYLKVRKGNSEYLFVSDRYPYEQLHNCGVQKIVRKIYERTENVNVKLTPHILRHTTATTARKNGMPIENISKMLGHQNINTTLIYAKTDINELRMEHERYVV